MRKDNRDYEGARRCCGHGVKTYSEAFTLSPGEYMVYSTTRCFMCRYNNLGSADSILAIDSPSAQMKVSRGRLVEKIRRTIINNGHFATAAIWS